jgi:hypothetical protein
LAYVKTQEHSDGFNFSAKNLIRLDIPKDSYYIRGVADETICLILDGLVWGIFIANEGVELNQSIFQIKITPAIIF